MLAIISAVQTGNITQQLQAERQMLKLIFAFDHINYACYNSFQQTFGICQNQLIYNKHFHTPSHHCR